MQQREKFRPLELVGCGDLIKKLLINGSVADKKNKILLTWKTNKILNLPCMTRRALY